MANHTLHEETRLVMAISIRTALARYATPRVALVALCSESKFSDSGVETLTRGADLADRSQFERLP